MTEIKANWKAIPGHCYLVPTPLGNLGDITQRALSTLTSVDFVACEDTRVTAKLLHHFNIHKPLLSYRDHNERVLADVLIERLKRGESMALTSDAGTPTISDPGFCLVRACRKAGLPVVPLPGPCAAITALSASGLPVHAFFFAGFVPVKAGGRRAFFESLRTATYSVIAYESCHRIVRSLESALDELGANRVVCVARELSKQYESFYTGPLSTILEAVQKAPVKGEYVLIIAPEDYTL